MICPTKFNNDWRQRLYSDLGTPERNLINPVALQERDAECQCRSDLEPYANANDRQAQIFTSGIGISSLFIAPAEPSSSSPWTRG